MKNKDLIRVLQALDPEQEVTFSLGRGVESAHRTMCAKAELMKGECLKYLNVSGINIIMDETDQSVAIADVILFCDNYPDKLLEETAKMYDEEFGKNRVWHSWTGGNDTPPQDGSHFVVRVHTIGGAKIRAYAIFSWIDGKFAATTGDVVSVLLSELEKEWKIDAWMNLE